MIFGKFHGASEFVGEVNSPDMHLRHYGKTFQFSVGFAIQKKNKEKTLIV